GVPAPEEVLAGHLVGPHGPADEAETGAQEGPGELLDPAPDRHRLVVAAAGEGVVEGELRGRPDAGAEVHHPPHQDARAGRGPPLHSRPDSALAAGRAIAVDRPGPLFVVPDLLGGRIPEGADVSDQPPEDRVLASEGEREAPVPAPGRVIAEPGPAEGRHRAV